MAKDTGDKGFYDKLTLGVVKSLEKRQGICDVSLQQRAPLQKHNLASWESKSSCKMPEDMKNFYLTNNGFTLKWNVKINETKVPVGHMEINPLESVIRLGGVGEQSPSHSAGPSLLDIEPESDDDTDKDVSVPKFDERSRIFELDPSEGYGKVCLVYNNTKQGVPADSCEVWFLDRAFQWHFMASDFLSYYRLLLLHLGLPQWQYAFTDIGLSMHAKQWYNMYAPARMEHSADEEVTHNNPPALNSTVSLDVSKVFKGKGDKKKAAAVKGMQKKMSTSTIKGSTSSMGRLGGTTSQVLKK